MTEMTRTSQAAWLDARYSVGGSTPATGRQILADNEGDEDTREALIEAFERGRFNGHNMESVKLISQHRLTEH